MTSAELATKSLDPPSTGRAAAPARPGRPGAGLAKRMTHSGGAGVAAIAPAIALPRAARRLTTRPMILRALFFASACVALLIAGCADDSEPGAAASGGVGGA